MRFRIRQIHIESSGAKLFDHKVFIDLIKYFGINGIIFANKAKLYFGYFADGNPFELHIRTNRQSTDRLIEIGNKNLFFGKEIGRSKKDCRSDSNQYSSKDKNADERGICFLTHLFACRFSAESCLASAWTETSWPRSKKVLTFGGPSLTNTFGSP